MVNLEKDESIQTLNEHSDSKSTGIKKVVVSAKESSVKKSTSLSYQAPVETFSSENINSNPQESLNLLKICQSVIDT